MFENLSELSESTNQPTGGLAPLAQKTVRLLDSHRIGRLNAALLRYAVEVPHTH